MQQTNFYKKFATYFLITTSTITLLAHSIKSPYIQKGLNVLQNQISSRKNPTKTINKLLLETDKKDLDQLIQNKYVYSGLYISALNDTRYDIFLRDFYKDNDAKLRLMQKKKGYRTNYFFIIFSETQKTKHKINKNNNKSLNKILKKYNLKY